MALYMLRLALRIDIEKMRATNAKTFEKHSETYTLQQIHSPLDFRHSFPTIQHKTSVPEISSNP